MKILVTVGTFKFDSLIKRVDEIAAGGVAEFKCQIGSGDFLPKNCEWFLFSEEFQTHVDWADIVITHAGAGTVYSLLEKFKDIVVVPNLERVDDHQKEISIFVEDNRYALQCSDLDCLEKVLSNSEIFFSSEKELYSKIDFFKGDEIMGFLCKFD